MELLIAKQILLVSTLRNVSGIVWRIFILILGSKAKVPLVGWFWSMSAADSLNLKVTFDCESNPVKDYCGWCWQTFQQPQQKS